MDNWIKKPFNPDGLFTHEVHKPATSNNRWSAQRKADGSPHTRHGASALVPPMQGTDLNIHDAKEQVSKALPKIKERTVEDAEAVVKAFLSYNPGAEELAKSNEASKVMRNKVEESGKALLAALSNKE